MLPLEIISPIVVVSWALLLILLERRFPYDRGQRLFRDGFFNDLALYTVAQSYILSFAIFWIADAIDAATGLSKQRLLSDWPLAAQVFATMLLHDFYIYWFHRLQHHSRWLWRIHEAHHSTTSVDWLSGSRSHSLEILINQTVEFAPVILLGCSPKVILIKGMLDAVWGMYIHSNIDVRTGWLQRIINGPEMHRWHHAVDVEAHNRNFGTKLALWDWIFGTAYLPRPRKPQGYGLSDPAFPKGYIGQHLYAFRSFEEEPGA